MPIKAAEAELVLTRNGYRQFQETSKVKGFALGSRSVYVKKPKQGRDYVSRPLVVRPDDLKDFDKVMRIGGVERSKGRSTFYHNANMSAFDKRVNTGANPTRYGYDFDFESSTAMVAFLAALG